MKQNNTFAIIILIAIFVFLNLIASQVFFRVDLTENKIYSLSSVSKKTAKKLPDKVIIKAFFSEDIAAPYNNHRRYTRDLLDEYRAYSHGNIDYEFINPDQSEEAKREAMQYRLQPVQIRAIEKDEMSLKRVFMGLVFIYGDQTETIPVVQQLNDLEYNVTSTLKKLTQDQLPKVGYTSGHGEPALQSDCKKIKQALAGQYNLTPLKLPATNGIPEDMKTIVIVNPQREFEPQALAQIDQFVMHGGNLAVFLDKYSIEMKTQQYNPISTGLDELLKTYGFQINKDILVDENSGQIAVTRNVGAFRMQTPMKYPFIAMITNFNEDHPITADLESAAGVFASSVTPTGSNEKAEFTWLYKSSENSELKTEPFDLNPLSYENFSYSDGPFEMAYSAKGIFDSYAMKKNIKNSFSAKPMLEESDSTKIVVVGDGDFILDKYLRNEANLTLFQNIVDWLSSPEGEGLISIRSREVTFRPLEEVESYGVRNFVKYLNVLLAPIIVIIYGLIRWRVRRRKRKLSMEMKD